MPKSVPVPCPCIRSEPNARGPRSVPGQRKRGRGACRRIGTLGANRRTPADGPSPGKGHSFMTSHFATAVGASLPHLRRYARALTGSQEAGDVLAAQTLEALIAEPSLAAGLEPRIAL